MFGWLRYKRWFVGHLCVINLVLIETTSFLELRWETNLDLDVVMLIEMNYVAAIQ